MPGIVGIDPGVSGACACYRPGCTIESGLRWTVADLPVAGQKPELDATSLRDWLQWNSPDFAVLEYVSAMPKFGVVTCFRLGSMFGAIKATLACAGIPFQLVTPPVWKKALRLPRDKEASRLMALQRFPDQSGMLRRKLDQNRAEAMLIAFYGDAFLGHKRAA